MELPKRRRREPAPAGTRTVGLQALLAALPALAVLPVVAFALSLLYLLWSGRQDETRRELAMRLIEDRWRPIGEITFELGFSQQSAFARAFRRWAGASPTAYRERLQQATPA
jgi:hypothetical protein